MAEDPVAVGREALQAGRWDDARLAFETVLDAGDDPAARFGLASALWWLGDSLGGVREAAQGYALFRRAGNWREAIRCAVWLSFIYRGDFGNYAAANGWVSRAERVLGGKAEESLHGWIYLARASLMTDLKTAEDLTNDALRLARAGDDPDLELSALSQLGRIKIGRGAVAEGFDLVDEAMAAALAGERTTLDTVVNTGCDMLNACELANDLERAEQWCRVADDFVERFGCPYLYAECRIYYGSVLAAKGRWADAEHELTTGIRVTERTSPGLHGRALTRLAALRLKQGRLEEASSLLAHIEPDTEAETEATLSRAALQLARGDAASASRTLEYRRHLLTGHRTHLAAALDLLVDAYLDIGDGAEAGRAMSELSGIAAAAGSAELDALASGARGRVAAAAGDAESAVVALRAALTIWSRLRQPFQSARTRSALGRVLTGISVEAAIDHLRRAHDEFDALGATLEADRAACELRALGVVAAPGPRGAGVLTEREQQVLHLVAAGLSNPEIAARLHVSRKTAAHHVSHILTKLNLRNRAEVVAYAMEGRPR